MFVRECGLTGRSVKKAGLTGEEYWWEVEHKPLEEIRE